MTKKDLYRQILERYKEIVVLENIQGLANWDMEVCMPKNGVEQRSEGLALLSGLIHDRWVAPEIGTLLTDIKQQPDYEELSTIEQRNIYLIQREYDKRTKIPKELVTTLAKQRTIATKDWKEAKAKADFSIFQPSLEKMVELIKQRAQYLDPDKHPYDVLLDNYEPGLSMKIIDQLFNQLKEGLIPLIQKCISAPNQPDLSLIKRKCPIDVQQKLAADVVKVINYQLDAGRIDEAAHPFTGGYYNDVRITTHYSTEDFSNGFLAVLHEGGHGLYEQNMPENYKYQPIGSACSSGFHEAQARFIENVIGRSLEFWGFYLPRLKKITGNIFADVELQPFVHALNRVSPSPIRIAADPVTYSLHIILRYEIEKDLITDQCSIDELPQIWNQKMKDYLDIEVKNDAEGILQDTHWAWGLFGYFSNYALGNIYDGQLLWKMEQEMPSWRKVLQKGKISKIIDWLITNIHKQGNRYDPLELVKEITGKELSTKYYLDYLETKYSDLYQF
ncbi:MAG: carboxypeptidase M32 [Candidatus Heimdallarchaeota archaeon]|nr:carboxypeptidase M32 [Candidatus Heimdallarchaeota archaeon]